VGNITRMRGEVWRWCARGTGFAAGVVVIAAVVLVVLQSTGVIVLTVVAILLAAGLEPFVGWVRGRVPIPRGMTVLLVYLVFFVVTLALGIVVVPAAIDQLEAFSVQLPELLGAIRSSVEDLDPEVLRSAVVQLVDTAERALTTGADVGAEPEMILEVGLTAADALISVITVLTLVFFWLTGHQRLQRFSLALLPAERRAGVRDTWNAVETRMGLWVRGQLLLMTFIFVVTSVAYFLLNLPNALLLGLIAGVAELIPIVGPALGAIPALLVAAASGSMEQLLLVAAVYVAIQVIEGNVLVPMVMKNAVGVPPFLVIVSLLVGASVAGLGGALLAVPVTAAIVVILERAQARERPVALEVTETSGPSTPDGIDVTLHPGTPAPADRAS
jgi:predicted PurR-regulated permease PerM